jgi:hypothetical protein
VVSASQLRQVPLEQANPCGQIVPPEAPPGQETGVFVPHAVCAASQLLQAPATQVAPAAHWSPAVAPPAHAAGVCWPQAV